MKITALQNDSERQRALDIYSRICVEAKLWPEGTDWRALNMDAWEVLPIMQDNTPVGACVRKGPELHAAVANGVRGHWLTNSVIDTLINQTTERYGYSCTKVRADAPYSYPLPWRLGFTPWKRDGDWLWLWLTGPWKPCRPGKQPRDINLLF